MRLVVMTTPRAAGPPFCYVRIFLVRAITTDIRRVLVYDASNADHVLVRILSMPFAIYRHMTPRVCYATPALS